VLNLPVLLRAFNHRARHGFSLGPENEEVAGILLCPAPSTFSAPYRHALRIAADLLSGFGGRKAPGGMGKISTAVVLRLRATRAVSRDQSVRRCAQDDDSVGELTNGDLCAGAGAHCRSRGCPRDDESVGEPNGTDTSVRDPGTLQIPRLRSHG
jgi:hypothetical protein